MAIITAVPRFPHPSHTMLCGYVSVCLHELQIIISVVVEAYRMNLNTDYRNLKDETQEKGWKGWKCVLAVYLSSMTC